MALLHTAHLTARSDAVERFKARLLQHAANSLKAEEGCLRFDVNQERDNPALFLLIEVYVDEAALLVHRDSPHYRAFRKDVKDWVIDRKWWFWSSPNGS